MGVLVWGLFWFCGGVFSFVGWVGFWLGFFGKARQPKGNTLNCSARNHEVSEPEG